MYDRSLGASSLRVQPFDSGYSHGAMPTRSVRGRVRGKVKGDDVTLAMASGLLAGILAQKHHDTSLEPEGNKVREFVNQDTIYISQDHNRPRPLRFGDVFPSMSEDWTEI